MHRIVASFICLGRICQQSLAYWLNFHSFPVDIQGPQRVVHIDFGDPLNHLPVLLSVVCTCRHLIASLRRHASSDMMEI